MRQLNRNTIVAGLVFCVIVSIVAAVDAVTRTGEIGSTPSSLYVFFVGFLGTLVLVRAFLQTRQHEPGSQNAVLRVLRSALMGLGIAGIVYMVSFMGAIFVVGSEGARIVAENVVWFILAGILLVGAIELTTRFRRSKG